MGSDFAIKIQTMNKVIILCACVFVTAGSYAQQKPHYTQYILNQYIINPALSGIENYWDIKLSHRHQWTGLSGSPVTTYFTIQGPIGKKDYRTTATSFAVPGENPRGHRYWEDYTAAEPHHGVGLQVINDATGPLSNLSVYGTYAYHIGLTPRTSLSAGFGAGFSRFSLKSSGLDFENTTIDPVVYSSGIVNTTKFDMTAGLYLYSADYFVGVSAQQIVPSRLNFSNHAVTAETGKTVPHLFFTGGYRFLITEDFNLIPSLMVKYINPLPVQAEVNTKLQYRDLIWVGASYRHKDSFAGMMGVNISNKFNIGYSYDNSTTALATYGKGTHEIILGFIIGNRYDDSCPKNVW
ncbi:type IX secretion system membrane protein PorP/SprF [Chitinophaga oryziterrae]